VVTVKILGAGSIGNHLAHASRTRGWQVSMCDIDPEALERTRCETYPQRYGAWDESIRLATTAELEDEYADLVIIGTPPDTHTRLAIDVLEGRKPPRILLIEKPVCPPDLEQCQRLWKAARDADTFVCVGYNHVLTENTRHAHERIRQGAIGRVQSLSVYWREHWGGIFNAHPWLSGPADTYLGFSGRGGGAASEHSHGVNLWLHFARQLGAGRVVEVGALLDLVDDGECRYDRQCFIHCITESGLAGDIVQDVVTEPAEKKLQIQGDGGRMEWFANFEPGKDALLEWPRGQEAVQQIFSKTRPDDFAGEMDHIGELLDGGDRETSPLRLEYALQTTLVIAAAMKSHQTGGRVRISYDQNFGPASLVLVDNR
jgi:predicted dehydrogenase